MKNIIPYSLNKIIKITNGIGDLFKRKNKKIENKIEI